jgi:hypothetical protein
VTRHNVDVHVGTFAGIVYGHVVLEERGAFHRAVGDLVVLHETELVGLDDRGLGARRTGAWKLAEVTESGDYVHGHVILSGRGEGALADVLASISGGEAAS